LAHAAEDRITGPVNGSPPVVLRTLHPRPPAVFDRGEADPAKIVHSLTLSFHPAAGLSAFLEEQQNRASSEYLHWLTPEEFGARFGLSEGDLSAVSAWLEAQGLQIESVARGRLSITFSGQVDRLNHAFHTQIHRYEVGGKRLYASATELSIPEALAAVVANLDGLNDYQLRAQHIAPMTTAGGAHYLAPDDFSTIYNTRALLDAGYTGNGQAVAVVGQTSIDLNDVRAFRRRFNLSDNDPKLVLAGPDPGRSEADVIEANLDVEWAGAVAPGAAIYYVYASNVIAALQYAIDQNIAPVISMSYTGCERDFGTAIRALAQQANAQGITWVAASGDSGAASCEGAASVSATKGPSVSWPASIPEVTAVGGTQFNDAAGSYWSASNNANSGSAASYIPEVAWNESADRHGLVASGGGASSYYPKPIWQSGPGVPDDQARDVPDVAFAASAGHTGYQVISGGVTYLVGGTSAATPVFAGILALVSHYLAAKESPAKPGLANVNPTLYRLAQSANGVFHDVIAGNNKTPCAPDSPGCVEGQVGYDAGSGYDLATGLGSVDAYKLAISWATDSGTNLTMRGLPSLRRSTVR
jgi:subtilase family serine protease